VDVKTFFIYFYIKAFFSGDHLLILCFYSGRVFNVNVYLICFKWDITKTQYTAADKTINHQG